MASYRFGPYLLSPDQRRLERHGVAIPLTPKAFDLLVALVRQRARALSKDEILRLVWAGAHVEEGNLAQQVLLLRRALADAGACVATVPRHGYRFVAPVVEEHESSPTTTTSLHALVWNGREFPLREGITMVGRAEDADLRIPLPSVSRQHARIIVRALDATLEDLGSRHGSWRGTTLVQGSVPLVSGDEIRLGTATLVYCLALPDDSTRD
jgi:DNA-binding winged helix-turn-helix (wHTH) protein